jgi:hypothetical protein
MTTKMAPIGFKLPVELITRLRNYCTKKNQDPNETVEVALIKWLNIVEKK